MVVATQEKMKKVKATMKTQAVKLWLIIASLCGGLIVEFIMRYMKAIDFHWTISQPISSALYSALCVSLFFLYGKTYSNRILTLSLISGIYGFLLLITLNGTCYTLLSGFIWHNSINFELIYRLAEIVIFVRTVKDARVIDWIRNTSFFARVSLRLFRDKDTFTGVI